MSEKYAAVIEALRLLHTDAQRWLNDDQHLDRPNLIAAVHRIGRVLTLAEGRP